MAMIVLPMGRAAVSAAPPGTVYLLTVVVCGYMPMPNPFAPLEKLMTCVVLPSPAPFSAGAGAGTGAAASVGVCDDGMAAASSRVKPKTHGLLVFLTRPRTFFHVISGPSSSP